MKPKHQRLVLLSLGLAGMAAATLLTLSALEQNIVFFQSPSDLAAKKPPVGKKLRIGGLVAEGSMRKLPDGVGVRFTVTDLKHSIDVVYRGILPDLFREGQGVVAQGKLRADGVFTATEILAKHDENYMPAEVADALKKAGRWKEGQKEGVKAGAGGGSK